MLKFLHTADVHLDSPFSLQSPENAQAMRQMLRGTFTSAMLYAKTMGADIVLMSGDIFDTGFASRDTLALIRSEFEKNPDIRFIISPGNHDPYKPESPWAKTAFPDNVYIFKSSALSKFSFDDINTDVYGWAFTDETMSADPLSVKPELDPGRINILCAHCELDGPVGGRYCTISKAELEGAGFDYAAVGHIHKGTDGAVKLGGTYYAYPGCLEGRSFDECGRKSAVIGQIEKKDGVVTAEFMTRAFTQRRFEVITADVTGCSDASELLAAVSSAIKNAHISSETSVRAVLKGQVPPELIINEAFICAGIGGIRYLEVENKTEPTLQTEKYASEPGIRGAFYRAMLPLLNSGDEKERELADTALRLGLQALDGRS